MNRPLRGLLYVAALEMRGWACRWQSDRKRRRERVDRKRT